MRRTHATVWFGRAGLVLALLVSGLPSASRAQGPPNPAALIVPINGTVKLQMTTKRPIKQVVNPKEQAINIRTVVGDPTTVLIIGQQPDVTRIELTDDANNVERYEVIVQADVEYLRTQLRRAVPTALITVIPTGNNSIILTGTVTRAEDVPVVLSVAQSVGFTVINGLRVGGVQQVQLDVVVARVARNTFRAMAFDFLSNSHNYFLGSTVGSAVAQPALIGAGSTLNGTGVFPGIVAQTLAGIPGSANGQGPNLLFGVIHNGWGFLGFLQALRNENLVKLMAEPRLVTLSGRPASFLSGGQQAVPVASGITQVGVQFQPFGTSLTFIPIVLGNGKIYLEVQPQVSSLDAANGVVIGGSIVPGRSIEQVNTTVELESGQTFVIGGLIQRSIQGTTQKTPVLGDMPFIGAFFSAKSYSETEEEVVVLVTPYLVDADSCNQRPKVLPGQETRSPDDFELFLEGILEAPRGSRQAFQGLHYVPPYKNGPSADVYPCASPNCPSGTGGGCGARGACGAMPVGATAGPGFLAGADATNSTPATAAGNGPVAPAGGEVPPAGGVQPAGGAAPQGEQPPATNTAGGQQP